MRFRELLVRLALNMLKRDMLILMVIQILRYNNIRYINRHLRCQGPTQNIKRPVVSMTRQMERYLVQTAKLCRCHPCQMMDLVISCWSINQLPTMRIDERLATTQSTQGTISWPSLSLRSFQLDILDMLRWLYGKRYLIIGSIDDHYP